MFGGTCWAPSALRTNRRTTEIFMNAVVVTTANARSPSPSVTARSARIPGWTSVIPAQPRRPGAQRISDPHDLAPADAPPVGEDVDRRLRIAVQGKDVSRRQGPERRETDLAAVELE